MDVKNLPSEKSNESVKASNKIKRFADLINEAKADAQEEDLGDIEEPSKKSGFFADDEIETGDDLFKKETEENKSDRHTSHLKHSETGIVNIVGAKALAETIKERFLKRKPLLIYGAPGIGKTDIVRQAMDDLNASVITLSTSMMERMDIGGVPSVKDDRTHFNTPAFFPDDNNGNGGILFLDELNLVTDPGLLSVCLQLILDRGINRVDAKGDYKKLVGYRLPSKWVVMIAGNRESDVSSGGADIQDFSTALRNRVGVINFQPTVDDWLAWAKEYK